MSVPCEEIVSFNNAEGNRLYGIVHVPIHANRKNIGINILNPGIKNRVAPHRLNLKLARELVRLGYHVLRFDSTGIGDSEGRLKGKTVPGIWHQIQKGLFVDDVNLSNTFFRNKYNLESINLMGSCGGAITSILAAKNEPCVKKLILIDVPINLDPQDKKFSDQINSSGEANRILLLYLKKLTNFRAWGRLFSLKSDYQAISKIISVKFQGMFSFFDRNSNANQTTFNPKFNYQFLDAFNSLMKKNAQILFVTAENDPGTGIFYEDFYNKYLQHNNFFTNISICKIKNANHIYPLDQNRIDLINAIKEFL